ncbi:MAG: hypothetical protein ACPGUD_02960 [Parashewanella sp.]
MALTIGGQSVGALTPQKSDRVDDSSSEKTPLLITSNDNTNAYSAKIVPETQGSQNLQPQQLNSWHSNQGVDTEKNQVTECMRSRKHIALFIGGMTVFCALTVTLVVALTLFFGLKE